MAGDDRGTQLHFLVRKTNGSDSKIEYTLLQVSNDEKGVPKRVYEKWAGEKLAFLLPRYLLQMQVVLYPSQRLFDTGNNTVWYGGRLICGPSVVQSPTEAHLDIWTDPHNYLHAHIPQFGVFSSSIIVSASFAVYVYNV